MLPGKIAFVDIETTGLRAQYDRIIEIGILRVEDNKVTKTFHSLINPQGFIPGEITRMTGITSEDVENAPTFRQLKYDILEVMEDCVFAAHNVRFDYGFLKNEFARLDSAFKKKHFCTVRLSQALYPEYRHHNLDSLIERFGFEYEKRHRAFDDAKILFSFYKKVLEDFSIERIADAIDLGLKKPSVPLNLKTDLNNIPEKPGVYIFYGKSEVKQTAIPLYIGKSVNLRDRVLSHFSADIHSPLEMKIAQQIETIETFETAGELGALILESQLIKKMLPLYNKKARIKRELTVLKKGLSRDGYDTVKLETHDGSDSLDSILGIFKSKKQAKIFLAETAKQYKLCEKLLGLEKTKGACFAYRLGRCLGACVGIEKPLIYNMRFVSAFSSSKIKPWPFPGRILITESDGRKKEQILINNWCYLGSVEEDYEGNQNKKPLLSPAFDLDVYNIVKQFIYDPKNYKKIKVLNVQVAAEI